MERQDLTNPSAHVCSSRRVSNDDRSPASARNERRCVANSVASGPLAARPERSGSILGAALHIKGEISGSEDLLVDGGVEGLIRIEGRTLTVGPSARIVANVEAAEIIVYGNVQGNLCALDRIEIKKNGSVVGELRLLAS